MMSSKKMLGLAGALASLLLTISSVACRGQDRTADLQAMADEMLPRLEVLSGLPARAPVRLAWQSRDSMRAFVEKQLAEEMQPGRIEGVQATYAAFGLIADTLDLKTLLLELYGEQVIGYYDPITKTLYVVEGAPRGEISTVLAHELVHALQDQHVNLDSLVSNQEDNDRQTAAQAAFEGQATLVMFARLIEQQLGRPLQPGDMPDLRTQLGAQLEAQNTKFPVFRSAPRIIRETMLFPYLGGAAFVQTLWRAASARGENAFPAPVGPLFPESTEQVIYPEQRFLTNRDDPTEIRLADPVAPWRLIHEDNLGELEVGILLREHLGAGADAAAQGWDGDRYQLLAAPEGGRALIWYSVWDDAPAADRFATSYRHILERRPDRQGRVTRLEIEGRPVVLVLDADRTIDLDQVPLPSTATLRE